MSYNTEEINEFQEGVKIENIRATKEIIRFSCYWLCSVSL